MKKHSLLALTIMTLIFGFHMAKNVSAVELITNGGFETGNFAGWTVNTQSNGWYSWQVTAAGGGDGVTGGITTSSPLFGTRSAWTGFCCTSPIPSSDYIQQDVTLPAAQTASFHWSDKIQSNLWEFCISTTCGSNIWQVQILNTSNTVLATLYTSTAVHSPTNMNHNTGWVTHSANLSSFAGQTIRIRFSGTYNSPLTNNFNGPGRAEVDGVSVQSPALVLAAEVSIGGRITTANGNGIRNVHISLTTSNGQTRTVRTNAFGYYTFEQVEVGQTVTLTVNSKRYTFANPTRIISISEDVGDADFVSIE